MKYYIIAGEASGDLHGSNLIKQIKQKDTKSDIRAWGGDLMLANGVNLVKHIKDLAFMGFTEVLLNIKTIISNISFCKADIEEWQPDCVIFIDYPGFNLRIAEFVKSIGIKTIYYISPQIWAWKENRVKKIKANIDLMCVILPFEKAFYAKHNMAVHYVGHPLLDAIHSYKYTSKSEFIEKNNLSNLPIVALLPGSRKQEIRAMLLAMLKATDGYKGQVIIAGAPSAPSAWYEEFLNEKVKLIYHQTYDILHHAEVAIVTSGTATLETALHRTPQVVCYKANAISYRIAKRLVKIKYISLVNLIMDKIVVKELIQDEMQAKVIEKELEQILYDANYKNAMQDNYSALIQLLGNSGASEKAAEIMVRYLNPSQL
jgi:lipid-A-disaccharide synthase